MSKVLPFWMRPRRPGRGLACMLAALACSPSPGPAIGDATVDESSVGPAGARVAAQDDPKSSYQAGEKAHAENVLLAQARKRMVAEQLRARDITDPRVLRAMEEVPRHAFVPPHLRTLAHDDGPLPIGSGQTISQPYIVALMTQLAAPRPEDRALDIGTGSGYQAAVLGTLCRDVFSIEIIPALADSARARLQALGHRNVTVRAGDGYRGWPEKAPFQVIVLAAAAPDVPAPLIEQLAPGGRLVVPVDVPGGGQELILITKKADGTLKRERVAPVAFVPMTGAAREKKKEAP